MVDFIKPSELPAASTVYDDDAIVVDNAGLVQKATPEQVVNAGAPVPTENEAIAGTDNTKRMTALRVRQVLDNEVAPAVLRAQAWAESPTNPNPSDPSSKSAKTWAGEAEADADRAEAAAAQAALFVDIHLKNLAAVLADTALTYLPGQPGTVAPGDVISTREEGYSLQVLAADAASYSVTNLNGVRFKFVSAGLGMVQGAASPSYRIGTLFGTLDPAVRGAVLVDGSEGYPNIIGSATAVPTTTRAWTATPDAAYVDGSANFSTIAGGYDNINNALAGLLMSQHSVLYYGATHASIFGGSLNAIHAGADYSGIFSATESYIGADCDYAVIVGGDKNIIDGGPSVTERGFRGAIFGGSENKVGGRNSTIINGIGNEIQAPYSIAFGGENIKIMAGSAATTHVGIGGANVTVGTTANSAYAFGWGDAITVEGDRVFFAGSDHTIEHGLTVTTGRYCKPPFIGAEVHASRARGNTIGNNMALDFQCSQETSDTTTTRLSVNGSTTYPTQPPDSVVSGHVHVTGVSDAGVASSFRIDFQSVRVGTGTPTISQTPTVINDGLVLPTDPVMQATSGGIYRVQVVGLAATNIRWNARFSGHQIVYT